MKRYRLLHFFVGKVIYQTAKVLYNFVMLGLKVFATSNSIDRLNKPLKSRFAIFRLPDYDYEEFQIGIKLLSHEYKLPEQTAGGNITPSKISKCH